MYHLRYIFTGQKMKYRAKQYLKEKEKSINTQKTHQGIDKFRLKKNVLFQELESHPRLKLCLKISWYSFCAFVLLYLLIVVVIFHMHISIMWGFFICITSGILLGFLMYKSEDVRCYVFLALPQVLSKCGRKVLITYCYILVLIGPTKNIIRNIEVLAQTVSCAQEYIKQELVKFEKAIKEPLLEIKHTLEKIVKSVKKKFDAVANTVKKGIALVTSIIKTFESVGVWLSKNVNMCNKNIGTPFQRCKRYFDKVVANCKAKYGFICNIDYVFIGMCYGLKPIDGICMLVTFINNNILKKIKEGIMNIEKRIETFFYVDIDFENKTLLNATTLEQPSERVHAMLEALKNRFQAYIVIFSWLSSATLIVLLFILYRVILYRKRFMASNRFDNYFINKQFVEVDLKYAAIHEFSALPLRPSERKKYIRLSSWFLNGSERIKFFKSAVLLVMTCFKLSLFFLIDYGLYMLMHTIHYHIMKSANDHSAFASSGIAIKVEGKGHHSEVLEEIVKEMNKFEYPFQALEFKDCLFPPYEPNYEIYLHIFILLILCWISIMIEPYILRLRNVYMSDMYPERAKERAEWLFNKILTERNTFFKIIYHKLKHTFSKNQKKRKRVLENFAGFCLRSILPSRLYGMFQDMDPTEYCKHCRSTEGLKSCNSYKCNGLFCNECWKYFNMKCPLCGEVESDFSEEKDSSDDDNSKNKKSPSQPMEEQENELPRYEGGDVIRTYVAHESKENIDRDGKDVDDILITNTHEDEENKVISDVFKDVSSAVMESSDRSIVNVGDNSKVGDFVVEHPPSLKKFEGVPFPSVEYDVEVLSEVYEETKYGRQNVHQHDWVEIRDEGCSFQEKDVIFAEDGRAEFVSHDKMNDVLNVVQYNSSVVNIEENVEIDTYDKQIQEISNRMDIYSSSPRKLHESNKDYTTTINSEENTEESMEDRVFSNNNEPEVSLNKNKNFVLEQHQAVFVKEEYFVEVLSDESYTVNTQHSLEKEDFQQSIIKPSNTAKVTHVISEEDSDQMRPIAYFVTPDSTIVKGSLIKGDNHLEDVTSGQSEEEWKVEIVSDSPRPSTSKRKRSSVRK